MRSRYLRAGMRSSARLNYPRLFQIMQYFKLEITIDRDGNITEKVIAGSGSDCTKITEELNQAIGNAELSEFLPEYFLEDTTNYSQPICQSGNL